MLTVNVKSAQNLPESNQPYIVEIQQGNMSSKTLAKPGPNPRYMENFTFNIDNEENDLIVMVTQPRNEQLIF